MNEFKRFNGNLIARNGDNRWYRMRSRCCWSIESYDQLPFRATATQQVLDQQSCQLAPSQQLQSNQSVNGHQLAQLPFQCRATNIRTEQLHWNHLCQSQISKIGRNNKGGEIKTFADAINKKPNILTCRAKAPLKSALLAYHALQNVVQSCPQQTFPFAGQKWNRLRQTVAK